MYNWEKVQEAHAYIEKKCGIKPRAALILSLSFKKFAELIEQPTIIHNEEIPFWPRPAVPGHEGKIYAGYVKGVPVIALTGRAHYYEGYTMEELALPARVVGELGVKTLVVTNESGSVKRDIPPGTLINIEDHINMMGDNPLIGVNNDKWGPRFPDMSHPYDEEYMRILDEIALRRGVGLRRGIYFATHGPSLETAAEVRMIEKLGADVVGMSTVTEVIVARHMGLKVLGISCVTNYGTGISDKKLTFEEIVEVSQKACTKTPAILEEFIAKL